MINSLSGDPVLVHFSWCHQYWYLSQSCHLESNLSISNSVVLMETDVAGGLAVNCWLTSATQVILGQICWAWSWENTFKYLQERIANLKPWKKTLPVFFLLLHAQNIVEQHPFVISCGILILVCLVILIFFPCSLHQLNSQLPLFPLHCSPSVPGPRYTQDIDLVDKRCVCNRNSSRAGVCPEMNSVAALVRAHCWQREERGTKSKREGRAKKTDREKSGREGGNDN